MKKSAEPPPRWTHSMEIPVALFIAWSVWLALSEASLLHHVQGTSLQLKTLTGMATLLPGMTSCAKVILGMEVAFIQSPPLGTPP